MSTLCRYLNAILDKSKDNVDLTQTKSGVTNLFFLLVSNFIDIITRERERRKKFSAHNAYRFS